jgi:hypothetical protein
MTNKISFLNEYAICIYDAECIYIFNLFCLHKMGPIRTDIYVHMWFLFIFSFLDIKRDHMDCYFAMVTGEISILGRKFKRQ